MIKEWEERFQRTICTQMIIAVLFIIESTQISTNGRMDKQNLAYRDNGILMSFKKEWNSDTCCSMEQS
jgi:hypothetical protein